MGTICKGLGILAAVLLVGHAHNAFAQIAKQGKFEIIGTFDGSVVESRKLGDHTMSLLTARGVNLNKAGSGFMHNTLIICMLTAIPGNFQAYCTITDADGDQIHTHNFIDKEVAGVGTSGGGRRMVFIGGTGKYKGIQGQAAYEAIYAPKMEGLLIGHTVISGEYRIP